MNHLMHHDSVYDFSVQAADGSTLSLDQYRGRALLIVNVASKCGFTPQYTGLQQLHTELAAKGFEVLGFPCNQFGKQEPGTNEEIASFCDVNFKVTFSVLAKIDVNGPKTDPLYDFLKEHATGFLGTSFIKWNFTKFLVDRDGRVVARFSPNADPLSLKTEIEQLLAR